MTKPRDRIERPVRFSIAAIAVGLAVLAIGCAGDGSGSAGFYGDTYYYDDPWYYGGCCVDRPDDIGPTRPHPEHPIANPPGTRPVQPIARPTRPAPAPRPAVRAGRR